MTLIEVDKLLALFGDWRVEEGTAEGFVGTIKDLIETVPTIEQPHWIPCSERLPEEQQEVLITAFHDTVMIAWLEDEEWTNDAITFTDGSKVNAWMPLPECYRGENDG